MRFARQSFKLAQTAPKLPSKTEVVHAYKERNPYKMLYIERALQAHYAKDRRFTQMFIDFHWSSTHRHWTPRMEM